MRAGGEGGIAAAAVAEAGAPAGGTCVSSDETGASRILFIANSIFP